MEEKKSKKDLTELIDKSEVVRYYYSSTWRYPQVGDDANTCAFLRVMLENEYKSGTMIFIPDKENKCRLANRNDMNVD